MMCHKCSADLVKKRISAWFFFWVLIAELGFARWPALQASTLCILAKPLWQRAYA